MIPVVAIVGRPNVGKSTLFNCLTQSRDAVVANIPGVTRDRIYGKGCLANRPYVVIDTGGIGGDEAGIEGLTIQQADQAILEANLILFVVDARSGLMPADHLIADKLRKLDKTILFIINKTDGLDADLILSDFYQLGFPHLVAISSSHRQGIEDLVTEMLSYFPVLATSSEEQTADMGIKIAIAGRPNVGKSTLVNRMLGEDRVIVFDMPGTTRDSIFIPLERFGKKYTLIDTAGLRRRSHITEVVEKISVVKTLQSIEESHVVIFLIDAITGVTEQDLNLLGFVLEAGKSIIIAINKWDGLKASHREEIKRGLDRRLQFLDFAKIRFISALHGTGVGDLFNDVKKAYDSAMKEMPTPLLTRLLESAVRQHQPPITHGHRIKLRYAHAGGHNPPVVVIHGNQTKSLPESYIRFLQSFFRKRLRLIGTPIKLELKESTNPFAGKKNTLTPRQLTKRKRMIRQRKHSKK
jgi:GTP-binding protein